MKRLLPLSALFLSFPLLAQDKDFTPMFNGKDLTPWVNVNCSPETWTIKDGVVHCTGKPTGALRTPRMYENFILECEWRHLKVGGNSGVFVWGTPIAAPGVPFLRGIEVQVLDNGYNAKGKNEWYTTHGDIFPIHGATMKPIHKGNGSRCFPIEERSKPSPEWNHYKVTGNAGKIRLEVNGKEVTGGDDCQYRKGYLALESEGSDVEFRNVKIKELPSTGATPEQTAPEDLGWKALYNGADLRGWNADDELKKQWTAKDWQLAAAVKAGNLWTETQFGDFEVIVDCNVPKGAEAGGALLLGDGNKVLRFPLSEKAGWTRTTFTVKGLNMSVTDNKDRKETRGLPQGTPAKRAIGLEGGATALTYANIFVRELK